ncbi:MAG: ATP-binding protein [Gaiellaceae bacterium]
MPPAAENLTLLRRLLDESPHPLLGLDENGLILELNAVAARSLGQNRGSLLGRPLAGLVEPAGRRRLRRALRGPPDPGGSELELEFRAADGSLRRLRLAFRLLPGPRPMIAVRLAADEESLQPTPAAAHEVEVALELERVLLHLPIGVIGLDRGGRIVFANARARRLFKDTPLRRGKPLPDVGPGRPFERGADGRFLPAAARNGVVRLPDGRSLRLFAVAPRASLPGLVVLDDVTSTVRRSEYERLFLRNAAHQIRTPLAGIANAIEVLQDGAKEDPETRDRFLAHIERESDRLSRLARAMLVLARAQSGVQQPRLEFVPLEPLLGRLRSLFDARERVTLEISCPPGVAALAEPDLLGEALAALVENAIEHTPAGIVAVRGRPLEDRKVEIEVEDAGEGILPERLDRIFEPFSRGDQQREGFGLGLAIAREAVAAMGGALDVRSEPGRGTCFSFQLPSAEVIEG